MILVNPNDNTSRIKEAERAYHDAVYEAHAEHAYPPSPEEFQRYFRMVHLTPFCDGGCSWWADARAEMLDSLGDVRGKRVLDYGCGFGMLGIYFGLAGAEVWGFDLSAPAVETANRMAASYGLHASFAQMDAANLEYPDEYFDLVVGFGVIHHVIKYPGAAVHLYRVMKPQAKAAFHETLWDNPLMNVARRFTAVDAEAGDAKLTEKGIRSFAKEFRDIRLEKRHLLYMLKRLASPVQSPTEELQPRPLWQAIKAADRQILRIAPLRRYCGEVIVFLEK